MFIPVVPMSKPRMTQRDKFANRPVVLKYWDYKRRLHNHKTDLVSQPSKVTFYIPMPASWPKRKQTEYNGRLCRQKPDADNLLKGLMDAWYPDDDSAIASIWTEKRWSLTPGIVIQPLETADVALPL